MALLELLLGKQNPAAQWAGQNSNFLGALGAGLASGPDLATGIGQGLKMAPQAKMLDMQVAEQQQEKAKQEQQQNATKALLQKEAPDLAQLLDTGIPMGEVWGEYLRRKSPQQGMEPTASMRDYQFAQQNPGYAEFLNPPKTPDQPASVQEYQFAVNQGFKGSITDYERQKKAAGRASMSPTTQKELFEAEDAATAGTYAISALDRAMQLNNDAFDGPTADLRGDTMAVFGDKGGQATAELKNITTELALTQLKTIFGAAPTEGERQILVQLQGSVNQPKAVREAIFKRAKEMAIRRIEDNKTKAGALRSGAYFEEGYGAAPGNQTSTGVTWSIEP